MNEEFLRLYQAIEAGRKCDGKPCHQISDDDITQARVNDTARRAHGECEQAAHLCAACSEADQRDAALREMFRARLIDLPVGILEKGGTAVPPF